MFQIQLEGVKVDAAGALIQVWYHMQYGGWNAFRSTRPRSAAVATLGRTLPYPVALEQVESTTAGMGVRWASDSGASPDPTVLYMLRWETLPENMDMARARRFRRRRGCASTDSGNDQTTRTCDRATGRSV